MEHARIGWKGLYLAMYRAMRPVSVRHTNRSTLLSRAIEHPVVARASAELSFEALFTESARTSL